MNRTSVGLLFAVCSTAHLSSQMGNMNAPTFTKDVAPILQKDCQTCHRPGEAAPFSMLTYEETRPWTRSHETSRKAEADAAMVCRSSDRPFRE